MTVYKKWTLLEVYVLPCKLNLKQIWQFLNASAFSSTCFRHSRSDMLKLRWHFWYFKQQSSISDTKIRSVLIRWTRWSEIRFWRHESGKQGVVCAALFLTADDKTVNTNALIQKLFWFQGTDRTVYSCWKESLMSRCEADESQLRRLLVSFSAGTSMVFVSQSDKTCLSSDEGLLTQKLPDSAGCNWH